MPTSLPPNLPAIIIIIKKIKIKPARRGRSGRDPSARPGPQPLSLSPPGTAAGGLLKPHDGPLSPSPAPYLLLLRQARRGVPRSPRHGRAHSPPPSNTCVPGAGRRREGEGERVVSSPTLPQRPGGAEALSLPSRLGRGSSPRGEPSPRPGRGLHSRVPCGRQEHPRPAMARPLWRGAGQLPAARAATPPALSAVRSAAGAAREVKSRLGGAGRLRSHQPERPEKGRHSTRPAGPLTGTARPDGGGSRLTVKVVKVCGAVFIRSLQIAALPF